MENFIDALKNGSNLSKFRKVDFHNHATYSCPRSYLTKNGIRMPKKHVIGISAMVQFLRTFVGPLMNKIDGLKLLLQGNFENCIATGVRVVNTSINYKVCTRTFKGDISDFLDFLSEFKYDNLKINWILDISRDTFIDAHRSLIFRLINTGFFIGLDLASTEDIVPNSKFIEFYKLAESKKMLLQVHAGEQLGADYVEQCILDFNPHQIQHGIGIVGDKKVMQLAKDRGIVFNVCPSSNVALGYAKSIAEHPIKQMVEFGLKVTIGTDDVLLFGSDINNEYRLLYDAKTLTAEQLDDIRSFGLKISKKYK